jgi:hypothetical protein
VFPLSHGAGILILGIGLCAGQNQSNEKKVKVTLVVILASEGKSEVDPRLKLVAAEVRKKDPSLTCFKVKAIHFQSLAVEEKTTFNLVDNKTAQVKVKREADKDNRVELAIKAPDQMGFVYQTVCGKYLPIITSYQTKTRERLILAVRVQPCHHQK